LHGETLERERSPFNDHLPAMSYLLGIDLGGSSVKVVAVN
jgi:hypothetical protein